MKHVKKFNEEQINEDIYYNYYKNELNKIDFEGDYAPTFKIKSGGTDSETKWMDLNRESAQILSDWLKANFFTE